MKYNINDELTLEDGITYTVIDILKHNDNKYVYLGYNDLSGEQNFLIRKEIIEDGESHFVNLDSDEEFYTVFCMMAENNLSD